MKIESTPDITQGTFIGKDFAPSNPDQGLAVLHAQMEKEGADTYEKIEEKFLKKMGGDYESVLSMIKEKFARRKNWKSPVPVTPESFLVGDIPSGSGGYTDTKEYLPVIQHMFEDLATRGDITEIQPGTYVGKNDEPVRMDMQTELTEEGQSVVTEEPIAPSVTPVETIVEPTIETGEWKIPREVVTYLDGVIDTVDPHTKASLGVLKWDIEDDRELATVVDKINIAESLTPAQRADLRRLLGVEDVEKNESSIPLPVVAQESVPEIIQKREDVEVQLSEEQLRERLDTARSIYTLELLAHKDTIRQKKSLFRKTMEDLGRPAKQLPVTEKPAALIEAEKNYVQAKKELTEKMVADGTFSRALELAEAEQHILQEKVSEVLSPLEQEILDKALKLLEKIKSSDTPSVSVEKPVEIPVEKNVPESEGNPFVFEGKVIAELPPNFSAINLRDGKAPLLKEFQFSKNKEAMEAKRQYNIIFENMSHEWPQDTVDVHIRVAHEGGLIRVLQQGNQLHILLNGESIGSGQIVDGVAMLQYEDLLGNQSGYKEAFQKVKDDIAKNKYPLKIK